MLLQAFCESKVSYLCKDPLIEIWYLGVPTVAQWKLIQLGSMRMRV